MAEEKNTFWIREDAAGRAAQIAAEGPTLRAYRVEEAIKNDWVDPRDGVRMLQEGDLDIFMYTRVADIDMPKQDSAYLVKGKNGVPGAGYGRVARSTQEAAAYIAEGKNYVLVLDETTAADVEYIKQANAVVTMTGGETSHASIVTRQFGIPALIGIGRENGEVFHSGDTVTIEGMRGVALKGIVTPRPPI